MKYDLITWKYDEGTFVKFPTTQSYKPAGTVQIGNRLPDAPHMQAIAVSPSSWTPKSS